MAKAIKSDFYKNQLIMWFGPNVDTSLLTQDELDYCARMVKRFIENKRKDIEERTAIYTLKQEQAYLSTKKHKVDYSYEFFFDFDLDTIMTLIRKTYTKNKADSLKGVVKKVLRRPRTCHRQHLTSFLLTCQKLLTFEQDIGWFEGNVHIIYTVRIK